MDNDRGTAPGEGMASMNGKGNGVRVSDWVKRRCRRWVAVAVLVVVGAAVSAPGPAAADRLALAQAIATAAAKDRTIAGFYRDHEYDPLWTGRGDGARRNALLAALSRAADHGLPAARYGADRLAEAFRRARTDRDRGAVEVAATRAFLAYARDVQSGIIDPRRVDSEIARVPPRRDPRKLLEAFARSTPSAFFRRLPPQGQEYAQLLKEKARLEKIVRAGGWGAPVKARKLEPGDSGPAVVALRDRLWRMGYLRRSLSPAYDAALQKAVQVFQLDHGLAPDGVAGGATLAALNVPARDRLAQIVVQLERRRWLNKPLGDRHILVNIPAFTAYVVDHGKVSFETRVVVGKAGKDTRTPEFSDVMTHMIVNPRWNVPKSIATKEYLPLLKKNPNAVGYFQLRDRSGRLVSRDEVDFSALSEQEFPFDMIQPPSDSNALGKVKFMFPNKFNIYLHDTPAKSLFSRTMRAYSHGCVRVARPFDLAYFLLEKEVADPKGYFHRVLSTGKETRIDLTEHVPVHIVYHTAFASPKGRINYRSDIYGRDRRIFEALSAAGVALDDVRS